MSEGKSEDLAALASAERLARTRRAWRRQHFGWALIAAFVLAGAAGLFGSGPLSSATRSADGVTLEFDRFIRRNSHFTLTIDIPVASEQARAELSLPRRYLRGIRISSMVPGPVQVVSGSEATTFVLAGHAPALVLPVQIHAEPIWMGVHDGEVAVGRARLPFTQFAWP